MATQNISYTDKEQGQVNPNPVEQKFTFEDANEIKNVVNNNATELNSLDGTNIELIKGGGIYIDDAIVDLQNATLQEITDNGNITNNPIVTPSINGASITSSGDGNSYLANDGAYKAISGAVDSVNGETGVVVLDGSEIDWDSTNGVKIDVKLNAIDSQVLTNSLDKVELGGDIGGTVSVPIINNEAITNSKLANMPTNRIKGRASSGNGVVENLTVPQTKSMLSIDNVDNTSDLNKPISTATSAALNALDLDLTNLDNAKISKNVGTTYTTNALTTVTQSEYDALTPDSATIYFII